METPCASRCARGPGVGPEQQKRLFQRFEQGEAARTSSRDGGSGLGLAICQELTVAMKGRIRVGSRLGVGTRFTVDLPCRSTAPARTSLPVRSSCLQASRCASCWWKTTLPWPR
ncbi:two-component system sensor histidine kinase-response regulator hybrid protein [Xanthomonas citri pv. aurantifolii str. ICPB 11122]|nr:two-component system sensor histidine kinase-response regulator hybrid protein [Xanthomonas citri pv. aurantifolii str. ICPB 11122]